MYGSDPFLEVQASGRGPCEGGEQEIWCGPNFTILVLDDFLLSPAPVEACRDLLEVIEDRTGLRSTVVASQLPVDKWHPSMADPTLADAVLDRLCQASHRIAMKGSSMRKRQPPPTEEADNA